MAALNIPLITWCVIVVAMTALITVRLFRKEHPRMSSTQRHAGHLVEIGSEKEEMFVPGDRLSNRDDAINDIDY